MKTCSRGLLSLLLPLALPAAVQADYQDPYYYTTNNGTVTITEYNGSGGDVTIPSTLSVGSVNLPVTSIGGWAFDLCGVTKITIPNSVTSIGVAAFQDCDSLTSVTIGTGVTSIGQNVFYHCVSLSSVTVPSSVTNIGYQAFCFCTSLASVKIGSGVTSIGAYAFATCWSLHSVTIPSGVTSIGYEAFAACNSLSSVYFQGNAPSADSSAFYFDPATAYYLLGTTGWVAFSASTGLRAVLWNAQIQTSGASFGVQTKRFGFNITGNSGLVVVVEACTNLSNPVWSPLQTLTLTDSPVYFSDPQWTNYTRRFYGLGVP